MNDHYLGEEALTLGFSPNRVAFIFPAGNRGAFRRAVQEASSRWAGVTEPIVPVARRTGLQGWAHVIAAAGVRALVNVDVAHDAASQAAAQTNLPLVNLADVDRNSETRSLHWSAVTQPAYQPVRARENATLWEIVAAGEPLDPTDGPPLREALVLGEDGVGRAQLQGATVLDAGLAGFAEYRGAGLWDGPTTIWFTKPNSLRDCVRFWNMRALRPLLMASAPMVLLPTNALTDWLHFAEQVKDALARPYGGAPDAAVLSLTVDEATLHALAQALALQPHEGPISMHRTILGGRQVRTSPLSYVTNIDPMQWLTFRGERGYSGRGRVQLFRQHTVLPTDSLETSDLLAAGALVLPGVLRVSDGFVGRIPRTNAVASLVEPTSRWNGDAIEFPVYLSRRSEHTIARPDSSAIMEALREGLDGKASLSDKGRLGEALLSACDCNLLLDRTLLTLIRDLTTPRSKELLRELRRRGSDSTDEELVRLASLWGGRTLQRHRSAAELHDPGGSNLEVLVEGGWVERGVQSECRWCGSWFTPLESVRGPVRCPGCGNPARLATGPEGVTVRYRLNSLADRGSDQGLLPHIAAQQALSALEPDTHLALGLDIAWPDGRKEEVDLFGYMAHHVVAGEVKSSANEFTTEQITRDVDLSLRLGATQHVMASIQTPETQQLSLVKDLCDGAGLALLVLCMSSEGRFSRLDM